MMRVWLFLFFYVFTIALDNSFAVKGVNWIQATESAPWNGRFGHTSVVFDNKIWVIGGGGAHGDI
jgi:hypothetical protein